MGKRTTDGHEVLAQLHKASTRHGARILLATERGSRSIDLEGPDSDHDVQFVYVRATSEYHGLAAHRDVIDNQDIPPHNNVDVHGWDVVKTLNAAMASSVTVLEALHGPIRHYAEKGFVDELGDIMTEFAPGKAMHSYVSTVESKRRLADRGWGDKYLHKGYLYALRSVLMVLLLDVEPKAFPPMRIDDLREALRYNPDVKSIGGALDELIASKRSGDKALMQVPMPEVESWIHRMAPGLRAMADAAPSDRRPNPLRLDYLCRRTVEGWTK